MRERQANAAFDKERFSGEREVTGLYTKAAGLYIKLSSAALGLTVTFTDKILPALGTAAGPAGPDKTAKAFLVASWICFCVAILAGAWYHYVSAKYVDSFSKVKGSVPAWQRRMVEQPGIVYGVMLAAFYLGAIAFTAMAITRIT